MMFYNLAAKMEGQCKCNYRLVKVLKTLFTQLFTSWIQMASTCVVSAKVHFLLYISAIYLIKRHEYMFVV